MRYDPEGDCYTAECLADFAGWVITWTEPWKEGVVRVFAERFVDDRGECRMVYCPTALFDFPGTAEWKPRRVLVCIERIKAGEVGRFVEYGSAIGVEVRARAHRDMDIGERVIVAPTAE